MHVMFSAGINNTGKENDERYIDPVALKWYVHASYIYKSQYNAHFIKPYRSKVHL